jgi:hypothetical protein
MLKNTISQLLEAVDENTELWNPQKWAIAKAPETGEAKSYLAAQAEADAAWERGPLTIKKALFLEAKADGFGIYSERAGSTFNHGETAFVYVEPNGFDWGPEKDGLYRFGLVVDLNLKTKSGEVIADVPNFIQSPVSNRNKLKTFFISVDLTLKDSLPAGAYDLTLTLHDMNSTKVARVGLPLSITGQ